MAKTRKTTTTTKTAPKTDAPKADAPKADARPQLPAIAETTRLYDDELATVKASLTEAGIGCNMQGKVNGWNGKLGNVVMHKSAGATSLPAIARILLAKVPSKVYAAPAIDESAGLGGDTSDSIRFPFNTGGTEYVATIHVVRWSAAGVGTGKSIARQIAVSRVSPKTDK